MKGKINFWIFLTLILSLGMGFPVFAEEMAPLTLESKSALLMDAATGTILYEKNSHEAMPPASVTKVMTMLLIYEAEESGSEYTVIELSDEESAL